MQFYSTIFYILYFCLIIDKSLNYKIMVKNTAFTKFHEELGAKMEPFCGYKMPIYYTGINDEHMNVREKLGVFDVSHMGEFWVKGKCFEISAENYN